MALRRHVRRGVPLLLSALGLLLLPLPANAQPQTLRATQDTYLRRLFPNQNQGEEAMLRVRALLGNRALLQFDQGQLVGAVGTRPLVAATLRLHIVLNGDNWGPEGRDVAVHRMRQAWTEFGATWLCPDDTNPSNQRPDCLPWNMADETAGPFVPAPTAVARHLTGRTGAVDWDVTADVAQFLNGTAENFGWLVKAVEEGRPGHVEYAAREGPQPPELLLELQQAAPVPAGFGIVLGQVVDASTNQALSGTTVKALGTTSAVQTDGQGRFQLPAPAGMEVPVHFTKGGYVDAKAFAGVEAGRESPLGTVRLQPFDGVRTLIGPDGGSHMESTGTVQVLFPAGAVNTTTEVTATVFPTAASFPVTLPQRQAYLAGVQFTPETLTFAQPVTVRIRNSLGIPAGTTVPFAFANHGEEAPAVRFFDPGTARVSADGQSIEAQLPHFSCIALVLPVQTGRPPLVTQSPDEPVEHSPQACCPSLGSRVGAQEGTLFLDQILPATRVLGRSTPLTLTYSSATADPHPLILTEARLDPAATTLPEQITWRLQAGPLEQERTFTPQAGTSRYAWSWEPRDRHGNVLPTGSHRVEVTLSHDYQGMLATASGFGGPPLQDLGIPVPGLTPARTRPNARVVIHNRQQSPFGAGWGLQGLQRLHPQPDGSVVITEGDGTALTFRTMPLLYATVSPGTTAFGGLSALDPSTGDLQFVFPSVTAPNVVVPSPAGDLVFVAGHTGVTFVDARIQEVIDVLDTIANPQGLAVSPDGATLYVVGSRPSAFYILDVRTRQIHFTLNLTGVGVGVALSPDGRLAHVAQQATDEVAVISTETRAVVATIPLGAQPTSGAMALSREGRTLFVGTGAGVAVIDATTNTLRTTVPLDHAGFGLALTPAGRLFVPSRTPTVTLVETSTLQVAGTVTLPVRSADGITVSPDGQRVFATAVETVGFQQFQSFVFVLEAATGAVLEQFPLPDGFAGGVAFRGGDPTRPLAPAGDFSTLTRLDPDTPQEPADDTWVRRLKDGTAHLFSASGLHLETRERNGNRTVYGYDASGQLVSLTDPAGGVTSFSYAGGRLTSLTDAAGRTTQVGIDGAGNLVAVTTPDGATTHYSYDNRHHPIAKTDPKGAVTQYDYDGFGRLSRVLHPTGEERAVLPSDAQGLLNTVPPGTAATPIPPAVLAQLTDGLGRSTAIATDRLGAATETTDPLGRTTTVQRSGHGLPLRITRPDGAAITLSYDSGGNLLLTEQRDPATGVFQTLFSYEATFNQVTSITDPNGNRTTISYDALGNPIQITDALSQTTTLAYDSRGLLTAVTDALSQVTTFTYDARGNLTSTTDPLGHVTTLSYDAAGNVLSSTDALGRVTRFAYDAMNRLTQVTDAAGGLTRYGYDAKGNLISVTDAKGQQTTFAYDGVNQLTQTTNPLGQAKAFAYDLARNLTSSTDPKGQTITFSYDAANQLTEKTLPTGEVVTFGYDLLGNLTLAQDADSQLSFQYDARGRLSRAETTATAAQPASTMSYLYDRNGNRTQWSGTVGSSGLGLTYTYDALNRLTQASSGFSGFGQPPTFTYDALSRRTSITLPDGAVATYTYDAASQLTSLVHAVSGTTIAGFSYTYDAVGNRTSLTDLTGTHSYLYDPLNRLTQATHPQPVNPTETFTYDPVGNRTSSHLATGQAHDAANRLLEDSTFTYTYDANGNLISKRNGVTGEVTTYTYDAENQLIRVERPGVVAEYRYDALGRRIEKNVNGVSTRYLYDNEDIAAEVDASNLVQALYIHGPGIDEPLAVFREGRTVVYHADGLGSITTLTDLNGVPVRSYTYDSFGRLVAQTGTVGNPYTYTSRELDPESGLLNYRSRYNDASLGRFLGEDAFAGVLHLPQSLNRYPYVTNNPVNFVDPNGKIAIADDAVLLVLGLSAGAAIVLSDPQIQKVTGEFFRKILEKIEKGQPITPEDINELGKLPFGLKCELGTPSEFPPAPPDPFDPSDPHFWDRPADWYKYTKWQKFRWYAAKVGIVISRKLRPLVGK
jgi:RHS repeat-associated protein